MQLKWFGGALHHACRKNHLVVAEYLVKEGADVNLETSDSQYFTPLHWYSLYWQHSRPRVILTFWFYSLGRQVEASLKSLTFSLQREPILRLQIRLNRHLEISISTAYLMAICAHRTARRLYTGRATMDAKWWFASFFPEAPTNTRRTSWD